MINNSMPTIPSFVSQAQLLVPIMHHRLSGDPHRKIVISKSLFVHKPFIIPIENADADCIKLEGFLAMLDIRMNAEFAYRGEITQLKNNLCEEFNKLCDGVMDHDFITFVRNQRQRMIDAVIDGTKIEQKMIAEQFYNNMMDGWDEKALDLEQFDKIVDIVLWKPLLTPFPIGALDKLGESIKKLENDKSTTKIEEMTTQIIEYMKQRLEVKVVKDSDYDSSEKLRITLEELSKERRTCVIEVRDVSKSESVVGEFARKGVEEVALVICVNKFLETESKMIYDKLNIGGQIDVGNVKRIVGKIERRITELILNFEWSNIGEEGARTVANALSELKNISSLNLNLGFNNIGEIGATAVSSALKGLKNILTLNLNFQSNSIGDEGAKAVSTVLTNLKNMLTLNLNLGGNNIERDGVRAISATLSELKNISTLNLNLLSNYIREEGAKTLSVALSRLINIVTLSLQLGNNNIGEEGAKEISNDLKKLKNISNLNVDLSSNDIGKEGTKAISAALNELNNISILNLDLTDNNIGNEGAIAISSALEESNRISNLNLDLSGNNIESEGAIKLSAALKKLTNISTLALILRCNEITTEGNVALRELQLVCLDYTIDYQIKSLLMPQN